MQNFCNRVPAFRQFDLQFSPTHLGGGTHPGTYVVPVSLALGEQYRRSGKEVVTAIAVGYEAAQRMAIAAGPGLGANGFRTVPTIGVFGAVAFAAVLSRLDTGQFAAALNFAANMACGLTQCFGDGTMEVYLHAGLAARAGITAASLCWSWWRSRARHTRRARWVLPYVLPRPLL
ncbi:MmgE/PrpD family protein [Bradyrhizobium tropiciagri]|uniref:MmgE/PrpD family protein n=1 Tax=Bradyrhizobium tropiciagri TaxID=312253 RepID=UPI0012FF3797